MKKRIYSSIAIVIILALLFVLKAYVSDYFFDAFFTILACFASFEMSRLLAKTGLYNFMPFAIFFPSVLLAGNLVGVFFAGQANDIYWILYTILINLALVLFGFLCVFLYSLIRSKASRNEIQVRGLKGVNLPKFAFRKALNTTICFIYPSFLFLFFILINHFNQLPFEKLSSLGSNVSLFILMTAIIIPMITDTFAMLMGSVIGGKKLCPKISQAKTISGAIGGVVWCLIISTCVYYIFSCIEPFAPFFEIFPIWAYLIIAFLGSILSQGGDLIESVIKRRANVKDSGRIIPGHGGLLDRIDSYIFMAPYIMLAFLIFAV